MKIDAHQHFWNFDEEDYSWIGEKEAVLKQDFLPKDLAPILKANNIDGCIAVQARQTIEETRWLLKLAEENSIVKGVIGWIDIKSIDLESQLREFSENKLLKGFRHVLQDEPDPNFMLDAKFVNGLKTLAASNFCYDILVFSHQLPQTLALVKQLPEMKLVVDHIAKPKIGDIADRENWYKYMSELAKHDHIYCKVSGMVTETKSQSWVQSDFKYYLESVFKLFGPERIMFGSDWPVCLLSAQYEIVKQIVGDFVDINFPQFNDAIFGNNARQFYGL